MGDENTKLSDAYSSTKRTRYYKSQLDPHAGDEDYKVFKSRTIFIGIAFPSYGLPSADTYESVIRQIIRKIRYKNRNRDVIGVYVPVNKASGQPDPVAYLVVMSKGPIRLSAIRNCLKGVGKNVKVKAGKRSQVDAYIDSAYRVACASYPGHEKEFGPFKEGTFPEPKKPGRKPKKLNQKTADYLTHDISPITDSEAAPSPARRNMIGANLDDGADREILGELPPRSVDPA